MAEAQQQDRLRSVVNDLVLAEMFLVQATIESATAIGDGISELSRQWDNDTGDGSVAGVLARTADEAIEPYTSRLKVLRELLDRQPLTASASRLEGKPAGR